MKERTQDGTTVQQVYMVGEIVTRLRKGYVGQAGLHGYMKLAVSF
jgi:hypothetical protein